MPNITSNQERDSSPDAISGYGMLIWKVAVLATSLRVASALLAETGFPAILASGAQMVQAIAIGSMIVGGALALGRSVITRRWRPWAGEWMILTIGLEGLFAATILHLGVASTFHEPLPLSALAWVVGAATLRYGFERVARAVRLESA